MTTKITEENQSRNKADLLIGIYVFCIVVAELMGAKTFPIARIGNFNFNGAMGMFLLPFIFSINDIFTEVFGYERTKNLARMSVIVVLFLIIFSAIAISLPPSTRFLAMNESYKQIFSQSIRISIASLIAMGVANFMDIKVFIKIKRRMGKSKLWLRNNLSNIMALFLDTVVFMGLAFYSPKLPVAENITFLWGIILPYWILKVSVSMMGTPLVYGGIKWLKK